MDIISEDIIRGVLDTKTIDLRKEEDHNGIFEHLDVFVNLSRENETVQEVILSCIPSFTDYGDAPGMDRYAIWEKVAEGISNLQALSEITICDSYFVDDEEVAPDWEILACILRRLRRGIELNIGDDQRSLWNLDSLPLFAGAIHGQAMIKGFNTGNAFPFGCLDILCFALLTLPALENVMFKHYDSDGPEEGQSLESMVKLLQSSILRKVHFDSVDFTITLSEAIAKALKERSKITDLIFWSCPFPEGGSAVIASALTTNTTLENLLFDKGNDKVFYEDLAAALLSNSTLRSLECSASDGPGSCSWLSPLFLALQQQNHGLKELRIHQFVIIDEETSTAMRLGLGKNSTLKLLEFSNIQSGDNDISLWRKAFSFLRTNKALKTLHMNFDPRVKHSRVSTLRMEVLAMLCENESLETLCIVDPDARPEDYLPCVVAIQSNTTLKSLRLYETDDFACAMHEVETKELIPVLKKNYGLEEISGLHHGAADIRSLFQLNRAGRRYLVQDGSSISKGVDVLSRVNDDINSVFLHLLENPSLCVRSAFEMASITNMDDGMAISPENHSCGKREQKAPPYTGNETRRRIE
jgi:hypothetical protein